MACERDRFNLSRKVFVGNISYRVSQKRLEKFFSKFGEVEYCYVVKDHIKKWSKGIAFVTFASKEDVQKALEATEDDLNLDGRIMRVKPAEESKRVSYVEGWQQDTDNTEDFDSKDTENTNEVKTVHDTTTGLSTLKMDDSSALNINSLCDDTLILILTYLPVLDRLAAERVCKCWRDAALRCWTYQKTLHFRNMFKRFEGLRDKLLSSLLHRCGVYLKELDLSASPRLLTDIAVDVIAENCPILQKLDLSGVAVTDISLRNLGVKCTKLKWIALQKSFYVGDKGLSWFLQNCVNLECLDVQGNAKIQGDLFHKCGPNLKTVILNECSKLKDFGVSKLCNRCKNLEELQLSDCLSVTDKCIRNLTQECQELRVFHLARIVPHVTANGLVNIGKLKKLIELNFSGNTSVNDEVISAVVKGCPNLKKLDISGCHRHVTDNGVRQLVKCSDLTDLNISYLYKVTDETIELLSSNGKIRQFTARACSNISDKGVKALCMFCCDLELLDVSGCFDVTRYTLHNVVQSRSDIKKFIMLCLGGTSVEDEDLDGFDSEYIKINVHDLSMQHLKGDRDLILPAPDDFEDEEEDKEEDAEILESFTGTAAGAEFDNEWDMYDDGGFNDEFLENDDPLEMERWEMS